MDTHLTVVSQERAVKTQNGWLMLLADCLLLALSVTLTVLAVQNTSGMLAAAAVVLFLAFLLLMPGFFSLQPNHARVLVLFGAYKGTVRASGFHWGNPFYSNGPQRVPPAAVKVAVPTVPAIREPSRNKVSLRARTLNGEKLKVNDKRGNPIEIGAVVVWRVEDTAKAKFDVDDYRNYVTTQSESALRHLASLYAYDNIEDETAGNPETTLRSNVDEVSLALRKELEERLAKAGVVVDEARLTHLAYAPEIAQAMLRRQQAEAVIAARQKIVHGAVSMVDMALRDLAAKQVVELDDERRAAMVSNLMVVLCSESGVHPVVNTGTLYN